MIKKLYELTRKKVLSIKNRLDFKLYKLKMAFEDVQKLPQVKLAVFIIILFLVALIVAYILYKKQNEFWSNLCLNTAAGLMTGLILYILSTVRTVVTYKLKNYVVLCDDLLTELVKMNLVKLVIFNNDEYINIMSSDYRVIERIFFKDMPTREFILKNDYKGRILNHHSFKFLLNSTIRSLTLRKEISIIEAVDYYDIFCKKMNELIVYIQKERDEANRLIHLLNTKPI